MEERRSRETVVPPVNSFCPYTAVLMDFDPRRCAFSGGVILRKVGVTTAVNLSPTSVYRV